MFDRPEIRNMTRPELDELSGGLSEDAISRRRRSAVISFHHRLRRMYSWEVSISPNDSLNRRSTFLRR
jgi:hypothetical protein